MARPFGTRQSVAIKRRPQIIAYATAERAGDVRECLRHAGLILFPNVIVERPTGGGCRLPHFNDTTIIIYSKFINQQ
jgi:hypothetical protein